MNEGLIVLALFKLLIMPDYEVPETVTKIYSTLSQYKPEVCFLAIGKVSEMCLSRHLQEEFTSGCKLKLEASYYPR